VDTKTVKQMETINQILESEEFNEMFDFEAEKKEIELAGWKLNELTSFGKQLSKQIGV
jgi:hypothetical protein